MRHTLDDGGPRGLVPPVPLPPPRPSRRSAQLLNTHATVEASLLLRWDECGRDCARGWGRVWAVF